LKLESVTWYGVDDTVPDVAWTPSNAIPVVALFEAAAGPAADLDEAMTSGRALRAIRKKVAKTSGLRSLPPFFIPFVT
jgi:hypothetical protein